MKKYNLVCKIRRANPYKHMAKATQEHKTCENKLERQFERQEPHKVFLTDITYIYYSRGHKAYLSVIIDEATQEILAYYLSTSRRWISCIRRSISYWNMRTYPLPRRSYPF